MCALLSVISSFKRLALLGEERVFSGLMNSFGESMNCLEREHKSHTRRKDCQFNVPPGRLLHCLPEQVPLRPGQLPSTAKLDKRPNSRVFAFSSNLPFTLRDQGVALSSSGRTERGREQVEPFEPEISHPKTAVGLRSNMGEGRCRLKHLREVLSGDRFSQTGESNRTVVCCS